MKNKLCEINDVLIKIFKLFFAFIFCVIIYKSIFNSNVSKVYNYNPFILIALVICYIIGIIFIYKKICKANIKNKRLVVGIIFGITIILQLLFSYFFMVIPSWDFGYVYNLATNFDMNISSKIEDWYLYQYPNNIAITVLLTIIFDIFRFIHIEAYTIIGIILNIFFIDISIFFLYKSVKEIFGYNKAIFALILMCLMTPIYTYAPIFYTVTLTMVYPILLLYLFILINKKANKDKLFSKTNILLALLAGTVLFIGMQIKITVSIIFIAMILVEILYVRYKEIFKIGTIVIISLILFILVKNKYLSNIRDKNIEYKLEFPYTHWIMMGINYKNEVMIGGYSGEDNGFTDSISGGKDVRKAENVKIIKERLSNLIRNHDLVRFEISKMVFTWGDGTYYAPEKLRKYPVRKGIQHEFILAKGKYSYIYMYYAEIQHLGILIFMVISSILNYKVKKNFENDLKEKINIIANMSIFGLLIFLIIWEARSRYIVNFIPIMLLAQFYGIDKFYDYILIKRKRSLPEGNNI